MRTAKLYGCVAVDGIRASGWLDACALTPSLVQLSSGGVLLNLHQGAGFDEFWLTSASLVVRVELTE